MSIVCMSFQYLQFWMNSLQIWWKRAFLAVAIISVTKRIKLYEHILAVSFLPKISCFGILTENVPFTLSLSNLFGNNKHTCGLFCIIVMSKGTSILAFYVCSLMDVFNLH